ncbi:hypothetical protein SAMN05428961_11445 [Paenibacillus sp. OK060]|uniref:hypothetical protein n=1 Tax=Paenibacillus sp. OK060 TaxID=1881034 RepID=UPI0008846884|nr:hypothetical protein [Paenibacillus sp. OK060]SDM33554.1 hypothetical protein SAMN05428961_11445 [Paenibacillus sp. OK060]
MNTTQNSVPDTSKTPEAETESSTNFKPGINIDFKEAESSLTEDESPLLDVLKLNLKGLVEHDHNLYRSGFVTEKLADAMDGYYSEEFQYNFSTIESIEKVNRSKTKCILQSLGNVWIPIQIRLKK